VNNGSLDLELTQWKKDQSNPKIVPTGCGNRKGRFAKKQSGEEYLE